MAHPNAQRVRDFLPELRPGWWVLRAILAVWVLSLFFGDVDATDIPFPPLFGSRFVGLLGMIAAVPLSVRLGRRQQAGDRRLSRGVHFGEAFLLLMTLPLMASLHDDGQQDTYFDYGPATTVAGYGYGGVMTDTDGYAITNLYATDADGNLIESFRLYDQNGRPVTNVGDMTESPPPGAGPGVYHSRPPTGDDGLPALNGFPRDAWMERYDGTTSAVIPPAIAAPSAATTIPLTGSTTAAPPTTTAAPEATTSTVVAGVETTLPPGTATTVAG